MYKKEKKKKKKKTRRSVICGRPTFLPYRARLNTRPRKVAKAVEEREIPKTQRRRRRFTAHSPRSSSIYLSISKAVFASRSLFAKARDTGDLESVHPRSGARNLER